MRYILIIGILLSAFFASAQGSDSGEGTSETIAVSDTATITIYYNASSRKFDFNKSENKDYWGKIRKPYIRNQPVRYIVEMSDGSSYLVEPQVLKVKPMSFKVATPASLAPYLSLTDVNRQPEIGSNIPEVKSLPTGSAIESSDIFAKFMDLTPSPENHEFFDLSSVKRKDKKTMQKKLDEIKELLEANRKLQELRMARYDEGYRLLDPVVSQFKEAYEKIKYLHLLAADGKKELAKADTREKWQQARDVIEDDIDDHLKETKKKERIIEVKKLYTNLDGLYTTLQQLLPKDFALHEEFVESVSSVNVAYRYTKEHLPSQTIIDLIGFLDEPSREAKSKIAYFERRMDATEVNLALTNRYSKDTVYKQTLKIPAYYGMDIDFTTGFVYNSLYQRNFSLLTEVLGSDTLQFIREQNNFKGDVTFGAFVNFSFRRPAARFGPTLGIGLGLTDGQPRYMAGGHLLLNRKQSWGFTGGVVFAKVNQLGKQVSDDGDFREAPLETPIEAIPTYNKFKAGWYFGIVWNFLRN